MTMKTVCPESNLNGVDSINFETSIVPYILDSNSLLRSLQDMSVITDVPDLTLMHCNLAHTYRNTQS